MNTYVALDGDGEDVTIWGVWGGCEENKTASETRRDIAHVASVIKWPICVAMIRSVVSLLIVVDCSVASDEVRVDQSDVVMDLRPEKPVPKAQIQIL